MVSACGKRASLQKGIDRPRNLDLAGVRSTLVMDKWIKGALGSEKGFNTHGGEYLCKQCEVNGIVESQRCDGCGESGSVQDTEMFFGL